MVVGLHLCALFVPQIELIKGARHKALFSFPWSDLSKPGQCGYFHFTLYALSYSNVVPLSRFLEL